MSTIKCLAGAALAIAAGFLAGCSSGAQRESALHADYQMGERVTIGPLTYNVVETVWRNQLGDGFKIRLPVNRFMLVTLSVTNGGGKEISVPMMELVNEKGETVKESDDGENVDEWIGIIRTISPAQTLQGRIVFDAPLSSYRLRVTDGSDAASDRYSYVQIPLRIDADAPVQAPLPGTAK